MASNSKFTNHQPSHVWSMFSNMAQTKNGEKKLEEQERRICALQVLGAVAGEKLSLTIFLDSLL
ncbi:hypothetical protein PIB30_091948 [Stylosanthes scabra]|uniref:Uncharacterized protein n=1 Tax=Stylosanthes scabra TaxID=79078 RepID=A0ABU6YTP6_9FABA|nr:hypothetical protein [Stylosanthes scabra]